MKAWTCCVLPSASQSGIMNKEQSGKIQARETITSDEVAAIRLLRKYKSIGTPTALVALGVLTTFEICRGDGGVQRQRRCAF